MVNLWQYFAKYAENRTELLASVNGVKKIS